MVAVGSQVSLSATLDTRARLSCPCSRFPRAASSEWYRWLGAIYWGLAADGLHSHTESITNQMANATAMAICHLSRFRKGAFARNR